MSIDIKSAGKKVLIVTDTYLPLVGGAELYTYNFIEQLILRGYEVTVVTNTLGEHNSDTREHLTVLRYKWEGARDISGMFTLVRALFRLLRTHEIVYANYSYRLTALATLLCLMLRRRMTVFGHGLGTIIDKGSRWTYYAYRFISLTYARGVVVTSSEIAEIVQKYNSRVLVATAVDFCEIDRISSAADTDEIRNEYGDKKIIVSVRRLVPKNGIQYMIAVLPYLIRTRKDFVYLIVGDGRMRAYIEELANTLRVADYVCFLGAKENTQAMVYMRASDVVVFPSSAEAMSLACIEAMHMERPVVTSAVGGLPELIGESQERGYMVDLFGRSESVYDAPDVSSIPTERYKSFAEAINDAISAPDTNVRVEKARQYVAKRFDWRLVSEEIITFSEKV